MTSFLIVDDHPEFRRLARLLLEEEGYEVVGEAEDGESGVAAARRLRPDVVLLDVNLPDLSGFDVARRIAGEDGAPAVLMTSTHGASEYESLVRDTGACGFVPKEGLSATTIEAALA